MNEYFEYLTELRDGGTMNMMWAPTMLQADFDLSVKESREVFSKWCDSLKNEQRQARESPCRRSNPEGGKGLFQVRRGAYIAFARLRQCKRLKEKTMSKRKKTSWKVVIKQDDLKVSIGHTAHTTGTGVHDSRPRRQRTRSAKNNRAIREFF